MLGNGWEWVQDCYDEKAYSGAAPSDGSAFKKTGCTSRVLRGASWDDNSRYLRAASRGTFAPRFRGGGIGFRVCRVSPIE